MAYNYHKAVLADLEEVIREDQNNILEKFGAGSLETFNRDELEKHIQGRILNEGLVTGNGNGSYFLDSYKSEEALIGNDKMIAEALKYFEDNAELGIYNTKITSADYLDITARLYEVYNCIDEAIDNVIKSPEKQIAEKEILEDVDYSMFSFIDEVYSAITECVEENMGKILTEAKVNSIEEYEYGRGNVECKIIDRITDGIIEIPDVSDREAMHHIEEILTHPALTNSGYTVQDYFSNSEVQDYAKECYAESVIYAEVSAVLDDQYDNLILPTLEQREAEKNVELD